MLFYRVEDLGLRAFFASGRPDTTALQRAATLVAHAPAPVAPGDLAAEMDVSPTRLSSLVNLLEQAGAVVVTDAGDIAPGEQPVPPDEAARRAAEVAEQHRAVDRSRVDMVRGYAETTGCRRQYLLAYFGEHLAEPCGRCDTCEAGTATSQPDAGDSPFALQSSVVHAEWGQGVVMRFEGDRIVVLFDEVGYRTLSLSAVAARDLLRSA